MLLLLKLRVGASNRQDGWSDETIELARSCLQVLTSLTFVAPAWYQADGHLNRNFLLEHAS
jgi:hypothetical protein